MSLLISVRRLSKVFHVGSSVIYGLKDVDIHLDKGEFVSIMGPSGSGKSTLLYILGCLARPTSGEYFLDSRDISRASDTKLSHVRANQIGFVFQTFNLLPQLNVFENVELPFLYASQKGFSEDKVVRAIEHVGLIDRLKHKPAELSGGEMQRVAIARALVIGPSLILADEPTGNLDSSNSKEILDIFQDLHEKGATIVMVTHDDEVASRAQRVLTLKDGEFISKTR